MTEAANQAVLAKAYSHFGAGEIPELLGMMSDDFTYTPPDAFKGWGPDCKHTISKSEFAEWVLGGFVAKVKGLKFTPEDCGPMGTTEGGVCPGCYTFKDPTNGDKDVSSRTVHRWVIKDGVLTALYNYYDGQVFYEIYLRNNPEYTH